MLHVERKWWDRDKTFGLKSICVARTIPGWERGYFHTTATPPPPSPPPRRLPAMCLRNPCEPFSNLRSAKTVYTLGRVSGPNRQLSLLHVIYNTYICSMWTVLRFKVSGETPWAILMCKSLLRWFSAYCQAQCPFLYPATAYTDYFISFKAVWRSCMPWSAPCGLLWLACGMWCCGKLLIFPL